MRRRKLKLKKHTVGADTDTRTKNNSEVLNEKMGNQHPGDCRKAKKTAGNSGNTSLNGVNSEDRTSNNYDEHKIGYKVKHARACKGKVKKATKKASGTLENSGNSDVNNKTNIDDSVWNDSFQRLQSEVKQARTCKLAGKKGKKVENDGNSDVNNETNNDVSVSDESCQRILDVKHARACKGKVKKATKEASGTLKNSENSDVNNKTNSDDSVRNDSFQRLQSEVKQARTCKLVCKKEKKVENDGNSDVNNETNNDVSVSDESCQRILDVKRARACKKVARAHKNGSNGGVVNKTNNNDRLSNEISHQVQMVRARKKTTKTTGNVSAIDCTATDQKNDSSIMLHKDLNMSLNSGTLFNTSTPYRHLKAKRKRHSSAVDGANLKLTSSESSLLDISLPTPKPPRDVPELLPSSSFDTSIMEVDSSDEEDLPIGLTPLKIEKGSFTENDIIWVKWKSWPYLPALVKKVYRKKKRLTCAVFGPEHLLEDFTMGYGNTGTVIPYCDPRKDQIIADAENLNKTDRDYFKGCLGHAENFLTREALKGLGEAGIFKEQQKEKETEANSEEKIVPCKRRKLSSASDCIITKVEKRKNGLSKQGQKRMAKMYEKTKPLTEFLVSNTTKDYLIKIYSAKLPSELHQKFLSGTIRERARMKHRGFGPIDDEKQIEKLLTTYLNWLREVNTKPIHEINYVFDVWVPEAVVFALKKQKGYGKKRAWEQFDKGVRRTKEELRQFHEEMMQ